MIAGPNAVRILEDIGVMGDLMKASGDTELNLKPFKLVSALGNHDTIVDVRLPISRLNLYHNTE